MRKCLSRLAAIVLSVSLLSACSTASVSSTVPAENLPPLQVGWSLWPGWMPWAIVEEQHLLEKHGANAKLVFFANYLDTQSSFVSGQLDITHLTINDTLVPLSKGTKAKAIVINDVSNAGDAILAHDPTKTISDLQGQTVSLELGSVSHFLLLKALEKGGVDPAKVKINNMPADLAGTQFVGNDKAGPIGTWNPFVDLALKAGANQIFNSSEIYGQISDLTVVQESVLQSRRKDVEAVVAAWYDALAYISDPATHDDAIATMAKGANVTPAEFEALLKKTEIFMTPERSREFMGTAGQPGPIVGYAKEVNDFLLEQKFVEQSVDVENLFDSSVVQAVVDSPRP
jgi:NitT/TauT family transport system substrate-binding protein